MRFAQMDERQRKQGRQHSCGRGLESGHPVIIDSRDNLAIPDGTMSKFFSC
jgi:hypothetical protein